MLKKILIITGLILVGLFCIILSISIGVMQIPFQEVLKVLFTNEESIHRIIVFDLRLPRTLVATLVGICLSLSGCILQGVMRNTLASPTTIGVTSGASFVGYVTLVIFPDLYYLLTIGSVIGAFFTTIIIYSLAFSKGVSPVRMILSGLAVTALFGAFNDVIKVFFSERIVNAQSFIIGSLNGTTWEQFFMIFPFALVGVIICCFIPNKLNILMLGDEIAYSLGINVERFKLFLIVMASLLSGAAVAVAGLISFVGLIIPHIARLLIGSDYKYLFPATIILSTIFMTICDTIGRIIIMPAEMPVSVIISFIGAPFFLYLLRTRDMTK
ncbi:ferrichrome ABC transporter [Candidatus Epulonipiscium fishelsonii]|uniref:Ferrichrome ABC transporter n=1 Tax=Candidatus Epulonipiscium fishelsonii TaxID=77094 RepID=A0ACC8XHH1_9FIRM|nr:ferrichrome ABC transporter [Epulopiscium sp. SCG-D08WGA-EpuloA1]OON95897.1 MAG: ferrichrome ABC transporter [Epulopiscium sp. AS2M-Bin002]